jgi:hypothetical protein
MVHTNLVALAHINVARSLAEHVEVIETAFGIQQLCTDRGSPPAEIRGGFESAARCRGHFRSRGQRKRGVEEQMAGGGGEA